MSCSYYTFRSNDYYCAKKQDYVNQDVYQRYCRGYSYDECPIYKGETPTSGCYLTSACVEAKGLADDCTELNTLRSFRDNWLKNQPGGAEEIEEYYCTAPKIVEKINSLPDAKDLWIELYETLIMPCVQLIKAGQMDSCHERYQSAVKKLRKTYLEEYI